MVSGTGAGPDQQSGNEPFDDPEERVLIAFMGQMSIAGKRCQHGIRDAVGDVPCLFDVQRTIVDPADDKRWHADSRQHVAHVDLKVHPLPGNLGPWAGAEPLQLGEPPDERLIVCRRWRS